MSLFQIPNTYFTLQICPSTNAEHYQNSSNNTYPVFYNVPQIALQKSFGICVSSIAEIKYAQAFFQSNPLTHPHEHFLYLVGDVCRQTDILLYACQTGYFLFIEKGAFLSPDDIKRIAEKLTHSNFAVVECGSAYGYADRVLDPRSLMATKEVSPIFGVCLTDLYAPLGEQYAHRGYWMDDSKFLDSFKLALGGFEPKFYVYKEKNTDNNSIHSSDDLHIQKSQWNKKITDTVQLNRQKLTVIAGPCMLETLELGLKVGQYLKGLCEEHDFQYIFKSSFDKANRTSASGIRGPGIEKGLEWLHTIKQTLNVPILTDVHSAEQAIAAARVADVLQIPAFLFRNKEILDACASTGKTIQIKKGQWVSAEDMLCVAQYLAHKNCHNVILAERGSCFGYNNLTVDFRNLVDMAQFGHAVVYDATHAVQLPGAKKGKSSGLRHMVPALTRAAIAVGIDGLFMEVHPNPNQALSDADTQLDFEMAKSILQNCHPR